MSTLFEILHPNVVNKENAELVQKFYNSEIVDAPEGLGLKLETAKDWYGIPGIKFIYWNNWADPGLIYKDHYIRSCYIVGVADGDIPYTGKIESPTENEIIDFEYWMEDKHFEELMNLFMRLMRRAYKRGGLFCNGVCACEGEEEEE